uniref:Uncharacterized protein n=1 Tax=Mustela putorius furo TaxID=9669 RepID=M3XVX8_MUSPF
MSEMSETDPKDHTVRIPSQIWRPQGNEAVCSGKQPGREVQPQPAPTAQRVRPPSWLPQKNSLHSSQPHLEQNTSTEEPNQPQNFER